MDQAPPSPTSGGGCARRCLTASPCAFGRDYQLSAHVHESTVTWMGVHPLPTDTAGELSADAEQLLHVAFTV